MPVVVLYPRFKRCFVIRHQSLLYHKVKMFSTYLTDKADLYYNRSMKESKSKPNVSIRIDPETLHKAKMAAVTSKKTLGDWLEEAITAKIEQEQKK